MTWPRLRSESVLGLGPVLQCLKVLFQAFYFRGVVSPDERGPSQNEIFSPGSEADGFGL